MTHYRPGDIVTAGRHRHVEVVSVWPDGRVKVRVPAPFTAGRLVPPLQMLTFDAAELSPEHLLPRVEQWNRVAWTVIAISLAALTGWSAVVLGGLP